MRLTHDSEADAAYLYLVEEIGRGEVAVSRVPDIPLKDAALTVDFDADGANLGDRGSGREQSASPGDD